MIHPLLLLAALLPSVPQPATRMRPALPYCPSATEQSDRIALALALAAGPSYASVRIRRGLQAVPSANVRVLTDPGDALACQRMQTHAAEVAFAHGGDLSGTTTIFYQAGPYYYAIVTSPPSTRTAPPGHVHVRTGSIPLYVFDGNLAPIAAVGM